MTLGSNLVLKTVNLIKEGEVKTTPQPDTRNLKTAYKLNRDNCRIDWTDTIDNIYNKIRGLSPYPSAYTTLINGDDHFDIKVYRAEKEFSKHDLPSGSIIATKKDLRVAVSKGYIKLTEIKLPGKRKMDIQALLNGYRFDSNAKVR